MNNTNKSVVITGAAGGIGKALCICFGKTGYSVIGLDHNSDALKTLDESLKKEGVKFSNHQTDITDRGALKKAIIKANDELNSKVAILINNAGINVIEPFSEDSISHLEKIVQVNLNGAVNCTGICLDSIIENKGSIINISTIAGIAPLYHRTSYCASKYALHGFMDALRTELGNKAHIMMALPTYVQTQFGGAVNAKKGIKNLLTPEFVAEEVYKAYKKKKNIAFLGKKAKTVKWLLKLFPGLYLKLMLKEQKANKA